MTLPNTVGRALGGTMPLTSVNSWVIIQNKVPDGQSSVTFNQTWDAYRSGFGNLSATSNYWIGNEAIYTMVINGKYKLSIEVIIYQRHL